MHTPHLLSMVVSSVSLHRNFKVVFERTVLGNCWAKDLLEWHDMANDCFLLLLSLLMMSYNFYNRFLKLNNSSQKRRTK